MEIIHIFLGGSYIEYISAVQIAHKLNNARVSHTCHMRVLCVSCHTHGILSLWLHTRVKLMTDTQVHAHTVTRTHSFCTRVNMHTQLLPTREHKLFARI